MTPQKILYCGKTGCIDLEMLFTLRKQMVHSTLQKVFYDITSEIVLMYKTRLIMSVALNALNSCLMFLCFGFMRL